jgi:hypothetical protein
MSQLHRYTVELLTQQLLTVRVEASCPRSAEDIARYLRTHHGYDGFREGDVDITKVTVIDLGEARS